MAKNDPILVDGIIEQRCSEGIPSSDVGEVFELFALEEILKDYDLTTDEISSGWIDGRDDGGIDGCYIFVNGHLLEDASEFSWPKSHASIEVWLITCKHHTTFQQAPLDLLFATIHELFDLSISDAELKGNYSDALIAFRSQFSLGYRKLSIGRPVIKFNVLYASRGDTSDIGESVESRGKQIESEFAKLFSSCEARFTFFGATELVSSHRRTKTFSIDLPFMEHLATGKDSYVLLVRLEDYWTFVSDQNGNLRRYLFDSNVRDYLGENQVNEEITKSLEDPTAPDFWWLNNGVTILATAATVPGKTIQLQDIQIVNGLQTTETIFQHFASGQKASKDRALLVKIIVSSDEQARDRIIRATNNQSPVEFAALRATDKIQRDIEDILERNEWYYERRKNYHRNIGKPLAKFVTPVYLASAVVTLIFKNPVRASTLRSKFMRDQIAYEAVFSASFPIEVWPSLSSICKQVDYELASAASGGAAENIAVPKWRALVALIVVSKRLGKFDYSARELINIAATPIQSREVLKAWEIISKVCDEKTRRNKPGQATVDKCCLAAAEAFTLTGLAVIGRHGIPSQPTLPIFPRPQPATFPEYLTSDFMNSVASHLPIQPWKQGIHTEIAMKLDCPANRVSRAIVQLIVEKRCYEQRNGVVYDSEGAILAVDPERVSQSIEQLTAQRNHISN